MANCNSAYILLCYILISPLIIEIILFSLCILGLIITYFGLSKLPFYIDSKIYKIIFFINIPYFIMMIILNIIFLIFRYYDLMINELHLWGFGLSIVEIYIALFGIITNLLNDAMIISNMKYYNEISKNIKSSKYPMITSKELLYTKIILPIILFFWINMLLMSLADNLLINLRVKGSYRLYELALKEERNNGNNNNNSHEEGANNENQNTNEENEDIDNNNNQNDIENEVNENNNDENQNDNEIEVNENNNDENQNDNENNINRENYQKKVNINKKNNRRNIKIPEHNNFYVESKRRLNENKNNKINKTANIGHIIKSSINPFINEENNMKEDLKNNEEVK